MSKSTTRVSGKLHGGILDDVGARIVAGDLPPAPC